MIIAIEGIDGSGKNTQATILAETLSQQGRNVVLMGFPCYSETFFGKEVGNYLNGEFGGLNEVPPKLAAMLYAGDRFEKREYIKKCISEDAIVVIDRYVYSNVAHQSAKIFGAERSALQYWIERLEYDVYGLPKPNLNILLNLDVYNSSKLVMMKSTRDYTEKSKDLHEENSSYLGEVAGVYHDLASNNESWKIVNCLVDGSLRSIKDISDDVLLAAKSIL
ncbi:dTMP kinase [Aeromonas piscicola]|uniref:dTMP kinase n=1 Tax=Aeromonas piscicola TaxID=600645 RepID=UPI0021F854FA|nr:dTMP kinase [Aeromonas piscicola]MCW0507849.1 dTMP kinase [Aeromonas piscicola]